MKALALKELRELLAPAVLILACAATLGVVNVAYNWREDRFVGISFFFCLIIGFAASLLGGANALARESRDHLVFLASWPVPRGRVWVVKLATNLLVTAAVIAASFGLCQGILALRAYGPDQTWRGMHDLGLPVAQAVAVWAAFFGFAFLWSALVRIPLAAAGLGLATGGLFTAGLTHLLLRYLPEHWGPWLGLDLSRLSERQGDTVVGVVAATLAVLAVGASAVAFARTPVLEAKRRIVRGLGWLVGMTLALLVVGLAGYLVVTRPSLRDAEPAALDPTGQYVVLKADSAPLGGVWTMRTDGTHLRLVARGGREVWDPRGKTAQVVLMYGDGDRRLGDWLLDIPTGRLRRMPGPYGMSSPSGKLWVIDGPGHATLTDDGWRPLHALRSSVALGGDGFFSPDDRYFYPVEGTYVDGAYVENRLDRLDMATGTVTMVAEIGDGSMYGVSPDGRWAAGTRNVRTKDDLVTWGLLLINLATGQVHRFAGIRPAWDGWSDDGRHLWAVDADSDRQKPREVRILDTQTLRVVRTIGPRDLQAAARTLAPSEAASQSILTPHVHGDRVYFQSRPVGSKDPAKLIWTANVNGTGLRFVKRESRSWVGITAAGELAFWGAGTSGDRTEGLWVYNPDTNTERLVFARLSR
jgi:hypothetical protein